MTAGYPQPANGWNVTVTVVGAGALPAPTLLQLVNGVGQLSFTDDVAESVTVKLVDTADSDFHLCLAGQLQRWHLQWCVHWPSGCSALRDDVWLTLLPLTLTHLFPSCVCPSRWLRDVQRFELPGQHVEQHRAVVAELVVRGVAAARHQRHLVLHVLLLAHHHASVWKHARNRHAR